MGLSTRLMRNGFFPLVLLGVWLGLAASGNAAEFKLKNGEVVVGDISRLDTKGLVVRYVPPVEGKGPFSDRIPWSELSQETLRELRNNPKARAIVENLILPTAEEMQAQLEVQFPETRRT
jgi:DNA-directed RNA polymerase subunit E'/Rpb7